MWVAVRSSRWVAACMAGQFAMDDRAVDSRFETSHAVRLERELAPGFEDEEECACISVIVIEVLYVQFEG